MPFTFSHPAVVVPLRRTRFVFSGLVVGSMAPDFLYFIGLPREHQHFGHTWLGLFVFCLPAGLAMLWLFHNILKAPLISLAPETIRRRIPDRYLTFRFAPLFQLALVSSSVLIGAITHALWDGLTHERGLIVEDVPQLQARVPFWPHSFALYKLLQFGSSAVGLLVIAWAVWAWMRRNPPDSEPKVPALSPVASLSIFLFAVVFACGLGIFLGYTHHAQPAERIGYSWIEVSVVEAIIVAITTGFLELVAYSLLWRVWFYPRAIRQQKTPEQFEHSGV